MSAARSLATQSSRVPVAKSSSSSASNSLRFSSLSMMTPRFSKPAALMRGWKPRAVRASFQFSGPVSGNTRGLPLRSLKEALMPARCAVPENWKDAMTALGFHPRIKAAGFENLGVIIDNDDKRNELLALLDELFATGTREDWVAKLRGADIVSAPINTLLEASNDPDVLANGYVTEIDYPKYGKRLKVHGSPWNFSETPVHIGIAAELGADNDAVLADLGYTPAQIEKFRKR